jgi:hypothetical protein
MMLLTLRPSRGGHQGKHAVRGDQDTRAAELPDAPSHPPSVHRHQTSVINAIRAHLAEFGIVASVGRNGVEQLLDVAADKRQTIA